MTIGELIEKAREIERSDSDTKMGGALVQVTSTLTIEECEELFKEWCVGNTKKAATYAKKIVRVRQSPERFGAGQLRNDVFSLLQAALRKETK